LRALRLTQRRRLDLERRVEVAHAEEMADKRRGPVEARMGARGTQRDRRDVTAVGSPDLPIARHGRGVPAVAALDGRVDRKITHAGRR
jgi:hypothetical protein